MKDINKAYRNMKIYMVVLVIATLILGIFGIFGISKKSADCEEKGGRIEAVGREWSVSTKTYTSVYDCVK